MRQMRFALSILTGLIGAASGLSAQQTPATGQCATPDSIAFRGQVRTTDDLLRSGVGITPKTAINGRVLSKAIRDLYATNLFDDIAPGCETIDGKTLLVF